MKKIFTLLAALTVAAVADARLYFKVNGVEVANNSVCYFNEVTHEVIVPGVLEFFSINSDVKLVSDEDRVIDLIAEQVSGGEPWPLVCAFGNCYQYDQNGMVVYSMKEVNKDQSYDMETHMELQQKTDEQGAIQAVMHTARIRMTASYSDDLENAAVLDLVFSNDPTQTAIEEVKGENGSFRFDGRSLAYDFQNKGTHTVDIFNAGGQLVSSVTLDDAHGVVSFSGLRPGAYIYRIRGEKKPMSGKMLVK